MGEPLSKQGEIIAHNADGQQGAGSRNKAGTEATARLWAGCPGVGRVTSTALVRAASEELSPAGAHGVGHILEPSLLCALLPAQPNGGRGKKPGTAVPAVMGWENRCCLWDGNRSGDHWVS